jgi:hypothetical protein
MQFLTGGRTMRKWMLVSTCALGALVLGTLTARGSDEEDDVGDEDTSEYEAMIEEIESECEATGCAEDGVITDEAIDDMGFDSLLIADAWGCCSLVQNGDGTTTCRCIEPGPDPYKVVTESAMHVGYASGLVLYDTLACFGERVGGTWSFSACGGCRKDLGDLEHLLVYGNTSTALDVDRVKFVRTADHWDNCYFADWWSSSYYWDSVTADGRAGVDYIYGSPQDDTLNGSAGNDRIYGYGGYDSLTGGNDTDYCDCGGAGEAVCETEVGGCD